MSYHALVIDDMPEVLEEVQDRLESLGHTCDCVTAQQSAREHLAQNQYSYILLDLEIPVRYGRPSRVPNGKNLLREIHGMDGHAETPVIVMTSHGHDTPDLAVDVMRTNGAIDYVKKPFAEAGHTLEKAVNDALHVTGRSRPGAATCSGPKHKEPPQPFEQGDMVFTDHRVTLCGVKICGGAESGLIRQVLDELKHDNGRGRRVHFSGDELADRTGCQRGQNGIAEAVRALRNNAADRLLEEANILIDPKHDLIVNDGRYGYGLSGKITVRDGDDPVNEVGDPVNDPLNEDGDPLNDPVTIDPDLNKRQQWALRQMQAGRPIQVAAIADEFTCSKTTAKRDLTDLRQRGQIEFVGAPRTGHWRLTSQADSRKMLSTRKI